MSKSVFKTGATPCFTTTARSICDNVGHEYKAPCGHVAIVCSACGATRTVDEVLADAEAQKRKGKNLGNPNEIQHGGNHYAGGGEYQTWDFIADYNVGFFEGNAVKYISRYKNKGKPVEDLSKAIHYMQKAQWLGYIRGRENCVQTYSPDGVTRRDGAKRLKECNGLDDQQVALIMLCTGWVYGQEIDSTIKSLVDLRDLLKAKQEQEAAQLENDPDALANSINHDHFQRTGG